MPDAITQIIATFIAIAIVVWVGQSYGHGTLPKALLRGLLAMLLVWSLVWFILDYFTIFDFIFSCSETYIPWVGRGKVCDYFNIPLIVGILVGPVGVVGTFIEANEERKE